MDKLRHLIAAAAKIGVVAPLTRASANIKGKSNQGKSNQDNP